MYSGLVLSKSFENKKKKLHLNLTKYVCLIYLKKLISVIVLKVLMILYKLV